MPALSPRDLLVQVVVPILGVIGLIVGIVGGLAQIFDFADQGKVAFLLIAAGVLLAISMALFVTLCAPPTRRTSVALASILLLGAGVVTGFATQSVLTKQVSPRPSEVIPTIPPKADLIPRPDGGTSTAVGQITSPLENAQIPMVASVSGIAERIPSDHELWLFVEFIQDKRFFPREGAISLRPDGQWTAQVYVGGDGQAGQPFKLNIADLSPAAVARIQAYFRTEHETGKVVGLPRDELDALGVKFLDAITVNRI